MAYRDEFVSNLPADQLVEFFSAEVKKQGFGLEGSKHASGHILINATQTAPWWKILLKHLPQKVVVDIVPEGNQTRLYCHVQMFLWYKVSLIFIWLAAILLVMETKYFLEIVGSYLIARLPFLQHPSYSDSYDLNMRITLICLLLFWTTVIVVPQLVAVRQLAALRYAELIQPISKAIERMGYRLDNIMDSSARKLVYIVFLILALLILCLYGAIIIRPNVEVLPLKAADLPSFIWVALLVSGACFMLVLLWLLATNSNAEVRCTPLLPGITTMLAVMFLQCPAVAILLHLQSDSANVLQYPPWFRLSLVPFALGWGSFFLIKSILLTVQTLPDSVRLLTQRRSARDFRSVSGTGFIWAFKSLWIGVWGCLGIVSFIATVIFAVSLIMSIHSVLISPSVTTSRVSGTDGIGSGEVYWIADWIPQVLEGSYALLMIGMCLLSILQFIISRRQLLRNLRAHEVDANSRYSSAKELLQGIINTARAHNVGLVIYDGQVPGASSYSLGLFHPKRYIVLSSWCVEKLSRSQLTVEVYLVVEIVGDGIVVEGHADARNALAYGHELFNPKRIFWSRDAEAANLGEAVVAEEHEFGPGSGRETDLRFVRTSLQELFLGWSFHGCFECGHVFFLLHSSVTAAG